MYRPDLVNEIFHAVCQEVERQERLWGIQTHADGTSKPEYKRLATTYRNRTEERFKNGNGTYADILLEEIFEALAEKPHSQELQDELIQSAAVIFSWLRKTMDNQIV